MKRMLMLSCVLLLAAPWAALAQGGGGGGSTELFDTVGVYLDEEGSVDCVTMYPPGLHHFYLVLRDLTSPGIHGFELKLTCDGPISFFNYTFPTDQFINVGQREGEIIVGFAQPVMATDGILVAMEFDVYLQEEDASHFFVGNVYFPSIEDAPCYLDSEDIENLKPLYQASGSEEEPVLFINDGRCGPVADEPAALDAVKSLYR